FDDFDKHREWLSKRYPLALKAEVSLIESESFKTFCRRQSAFSKLLRTEASRTSRRSNDLFTRTYAGNYFGVRQAIEADAIIRAISFKHSKALITDDHKRWLTIALG